MYSSWGGGAQQRGCPVREKKVEGVKMKERQGGSWGEERNHLSLLHQICYRPLTAIPL